MSSINSIKTPGLYIHIPFCLSKCPYCDFYSITSISAIPDFLNGLFREMEMYRDRFEPFDTIYIGGGTPSFLSPQQLESILKNIRKTFSLAPDMEITIETNPADLNRSFLDSIRKTGISRINIGVQSFDEKTLDFLGRRHSVRQAFSAVEDARKSGFHNMGLDLIYGVPNQDMDSWFETLKQALAFSPEHLSCYQLTIESNTPLGRRFQAGKCSSPGEALQCEFFMKTSQFLEEAGYTHYEVSNFSRGFAYASRHNQKYWNHSPYLGLGPSAHSFTSDQRWWNYRSLDQYLEAINRGRPPLKGKEMLTLEQLRLEALYLSLRTKRGVDLKEFKNQYTCDLLTEKKEVLTTLEKEGLVSIRDGFLSPTEAGLAVADSLASI
jgi:oxygen-independent coproporphyrinogen-3 oxidase